MNDINFTLTEFLALIGVVQCVFILVFISFRARSMHKTVAPFAYFLLLGGVFLGDFGRKFLGADLEFYDLVILWLWFTSIAMSVIVVMQIAYERQALGIWPYTLLCIPALVLFLAYGFSNAFEECAPPYKVCPAFYNWFIVGGILSSSIALLSLWADKDIFSDLRKQKFGQEKYWLVLTIIISNSIAIAVMFSSLQSPSPVDQIVNIRILLGLAFVYLVTTSLFRLYPYLSVKPEVRLSQTLNADDKRLVERIQRLLEFEKVYQEPGYNRASLAQELGVPEVSISRVINSHFGQSLPQILNRYRVEDAKQLLGQTDMPIADIAREAGFSSLATFNRVFREITGDTPSAFRQGL
jgi:AraC-like DNA-binding protein